MQSPQIPSSMYWLNTNFKRLDKSIPLANEKWTKLTVDDLFVHSDDIYWMEIDKNESWSEQGKSW